MNHSFSVRLGICVVLALPIGCTSNDNPGEPTASGNAAGKSNLSAGGNHAGGVSTSSKSQGGASVTPNGGSGQVQNTVKAGMANSGGSVDEGGTVAIGGLTATGGRSVGGISGQPTTCGTGCSMPAGAAGKGGYGGVAGHAGAPGTTVIWTGGGNATGSVGGCGEVAGRCGLNLVAGGGYAGITGHAGMTNRGGTAGSSSTTAPSCSSYSSDLTCMTNTDCCLVYNECYAALWLVKRSNANAMSACFSSLSHSMCPACMPPAVQVSCQSSKCVATEVPGGAYELMQPHCGTDATAGASSISAKAPTPYDEPLPAGADTATGGAGSGSVHFGCG